MGKSPSPSQREKHNKGNLKKIIAPGNALEPTFEGKAGTLRTGGEKGEKIAHRIH